MYGAGHEIEKLNENHELNHELFILLHTQSIVCATVWSQGLEYLVYITLVLVLKLTPINTVSLNKVFLIPQNQCYPGNTCKYSRSRTTDKRRLNP
jgi:hypothetical protein